MPDSIIGRILYSSTNSTQISLGIFLDRWRIARIAGVTRSTVRIYKDSFYFVFLPLLSLSLSFFLPFFLSLSLSCQEILWTSIDVISIPIDPRSLALISDGRIKTDGQTASGPGGAAGSGSGGIEGFEAASSTPVASHGGLQRGRRLHHRYWILITADRLDASTVSSLLLFFPSPSLSSPIRDLRPAWL